MTVADLSPRALVLAVLILLVALPARAGAWSVVGESPATGSGVFRFPQALTYTPGAGAVFVGDQYSGVVQRFARDGTWQADIGWFADKGELQRLGTIGGLATDRDGHLFVLDSENDRVQVFAVSDGRWLGAWGSSGSAPGELNLGNNTGAGGIAIDQAAPGQVATVFIADQYNHRIQRFALSGSTSGGDRVLPPGSASGDVVAAPTPAAVWGRFGDCTPSQCTDPSAGQALQYPQGLAVDGVTHDVLVADDRNHRVVEFTADGAFVRQVGHFGTAAGEFRFPYDVGIDVGAPRRVYVADNNNHRVQAFDAASLAFATAWGTFGPEPGNLAYPRALGALADDPAGGVALADTANDRVQAFSAAGTVTGSWGIPGRGPGYVTRPRAVTFDDAGRIHVADTLDHRVEHLAPDGTYVGQTGYVSANSGFAAPAAGPGQFNLPSGIAQRTSDGHLFVADTRNDQVQELGVDGSFVAAHGGFTRPRGVAAAPDGSVLVADTDANRIARLAPGGDWSTVAVPGGETLSRPAGVAVAADGTILVADTGHDRVLRIAGGDAQPLPGSYAQPAGVAAAGADVYVADTGASRIVRVTGGVTPAVIAGEGRAVGEVVAPNGLAVDRAGTQLLVADTGNNRLQRLALGGAAEPAAPPQLGVTVDGPGIVTSAPAGIACPPDCRQAFTAGTAVVLTATPRAGAAFTGWSGACSGAAPTCTVTAGSAAQVGARFGAAPPPAPPPPPPRPLPGPTAPVPSSVDRTRPALAVAGRIARALRPTRAGGLVTRRTLRGGALLRVRLSEPATVSFRLAGRRGVLALQLPRGTSRVRITGRLSGRRLRGGAYRLLVRAVDRAGNASPTRTVRFRVR